MRAETYLQFWGKAQGERPGEPLWHPVAYHNLDVAAVADVLLRSNPRRLSAMARMLGASDDATRVFLVAMIALHDIGKFSSAFQAKVPEFYPTCLTPWTQDTSVRHDLLGSELRERVWSAFGSKITGWSKSARFYQIWHSVSGHHGKPMTGPAQELPKGMRSANFAALDAFIADVLALFSNTTPLTQPDQATAARLSWAIAGLTVLADWIGSNRDRFWYCKPTESLAEYWPLALRKAETAVAQAGISNVPLSSTASPAHLLPKYIADALSPLQVFADTVALPDGPVLAIIEDVTGSGKTEAALLLAARLMQANRASGIFFALPTMATANAMYERLGDMYRRLFADDAVPSLVLAHGRQALHPGFQDTILKSPTAANQGVASAGELSGNESGAACAAWIADSRRKAFLAHVGVGTIDQALLSVLPSKFQALRLWGLADRVLIVDEAHAYDAYMGKEIETVLEFQAALGGSAIILSATLPETQRRALVAAYSRGLGLKAKLQPVSDYPLVTLVGALGVHAHPVDTREDRKRRLSVRRIGGIDDAVAHVVAMAEKKAAVAWIRNSVDDAIEAVQTLERHGLNPVLLHARFAMGHRLDIERQVTETLGRPGAKRQGDRPGFVLVGTQILEQSLDYDVDAMIVDLAPIDLMVQRAGRLWRHAERDSDRPVTSPELLVHAPDPAPALVSDPGWYGPISKRAGFVYRHHGIVWRSAKVLFETGHITTPEGVRRLIEQVYGPLELDDIPKPLRKNSQAAIGEAGASLHCAKMNVLKFGAGYDGADNESNWQPDTVTPTRLGLPVTVFRLGVVRNGRIEPLCWSEDKDLRLSWALSEVSIAQTKIDAEPAAPPERASLIAAAKASWPPWEREGQPLLVLEPDGTDGGWRSAALKTGKGERPVLYDKRLGFRVVA